MQVSQSRGTITNGILLPIDRVIQAGRYVRLISSTPHIPQRTLEQRDQDLHRLSKKIEKLIILIFVAYGIFLINHYGQNLSGFERALLVLGCLGVGKIASAILNRCD